MRKGSPTEMFIGLHVSVLTLMGLAIFAAAGFTPDDARSAAPAITTDSNGDNAPLPDFDGDGTVGFGDFVKFAAKFGLGEGDEGYDAQYDLNGDGEIGFADFVTFAKSFGKEIPHDDRAVLVAFYEATEGPNWTNRKNWLSDRPVGEWYGVVTDANGNVTGLSQWKNNLHGTIPSELGRLTKLTRLDLDSNQLTGTIPKELAYLANLEHLSLGWNQLTGTIPIELTQMSNLKHLTLGVNQLTGNIPIELAQLANLEHLHLGGNPLAGKIPTELGQLIKLRWLSLDNNQLTGDIPEELGRLTNLTYLDLFTNHLTGTIPAELRQLTKLTSLDLGTNQLTGAIPIGLGQMTDLTYLDLRANQLTGTIPTNLGRLTNLRKLYLNLNQLTGTIPTELGQLTNLTHLYLAYNQLTGTLPAELASLTNLEHLILGANADLSGPLPETFTDLAPEALELYGTQLCIPLTSAFTDWLDNIPHSPGAAHCANPEREALTALYKQTSGPSWKNKENWSTLAPLGEWYGVTTGTDGRVTHLNLRDNNLSGLLPPSLSSLANLKTLNLTGNATLFGPLPQVFTVLPLETLNLDGTRVCAPPRADFQSWLNGIRDRDIDQCTDTRTDYYPLVALYSGTDGRNWMNATNWASTRPLAEWHGVTVDANGRVTELNLEENHLAGPLPAGLDQLTKLTRLSLSSNQLTGNIPSELGQLASLNFLGLHTNQLTGEIPPQLGQLANLETLWLGTNGLTGGIPMELGQLNNLKWLELIRNQLTGEIPSELGQLSSLRTLDLSNNPLDGEIPPELGQLTSLESLTLWFNNLTGEIPPELGRLANLRKLWIADNYLTGSIPPELGQLFNLESLYLINHTLTGEIPPELGRLTNLRELDLRINQLTGSIPAELGRLINLRTLDLSTNLLNRNVPSELGRLTHLTRLNLSKNQLSGKIPSELGQLTRLTQMDLGTNRLTGNIPPELGNLTGLTTLNLSTNQLSGNIPVELGQLTNLTSLNLAFNAGMSGTVPAALTGLALKTLQLQETLLCSPQDVAFQQWLRTLSFIRVPNCARTDEAAAYLTQAAQSLEYPVPLVAGDDALLRVFVTAPRDVEAAMPPVRATFYQDGARVHTAEIPAQAASIPWQVNEGSLAGSANALVPGRVVTPGVEMVVEIDPEQTLDPAVGIVSRLPETGRTALDVRSVPPLELTLIPFLWEENPDRSVLTRTEGLSAESELFRATRDLLPVREFRLKVHEAVMTSVDPTSDSAQQLGPEVNLIYAMEGAKGYYMGIFRSVGQSGLEGIAQLSAFTSQSILDENVIAHELGHNLSLLHAPACGAGGPDPEYPYEEGDIGSWGYDFINEALVSPATSDLMSYCRPQWISDYSFTRALARRIQAEGAPLAAAKAAPAKGLLIWGGLSENETLFLEPAFVVSAPPSLPRGDGPYLLAGEDEAGNTLFSLPFGMPEYGCGGKGGSFAFIIQVEDDWSGRLARIALSGPEGADFLDGEDDPSAALLLDRATGDVRGILRDWTEAAAKRPAESLASPELQVLTSYGIPDAASWQQ